MAKSTPKAKAKTFKDSLASTLPWNHTSFGEDVEIEAAAAIGAAIHVLGARGG